MSQINKTDRSTVRRVPSRGIYDRKTIYEILDEAFVCHVGLVQDGAPVVIPMVYGRFEDKLLLHGAKSSRLIKSFVSGNPVCVTVTILDALVLARSAYHHSMNYRSVVIHGKGQRIENEEEKNQMLNVIAEHIIPGRWDEVRKPIEKELNATEVVYLTIDEATAKMRTGPAVDEKEDYEFPVWAGLLPLELKSGQPQTDPEMKMQLDVPDYVTNYRKK